MKDMATLVPPSDWKILSEKEKQDFIEQTFGESQENIMTIATPKQGDGSVFAQLLFQPIGYIEDKTPIDSKIVQQNIVNEISILNSENDANADDKVRWKRFVIRPKYDVKTRCAEYGIELAFGRENVVNLYKMCLLRNGALVLTLVGEPKDRLTLQGWQIKPAENLKYEKFDPNKDDRAEGNLNNLLSMNQII